MASAANSIGGALTVAFAMVASALVAWLMNLSVKERAKLHDIEIAQLRSQLASSEERLRGSVARDVATHESALRVSGELRLRLFAQAAKSTATAARELSETLGKLVGFSSALETDSNVSGALVKLLGTPELLLHTGVLLPPELDEPYAIASGAIVMAITAVARLHDTDDRAQHEQAALALTNAHETTHGFRRAATTWKASAWASVQNIGAHASPSSASTIESAHA